MSEIKSEKTEQCPIAETEDTNIEQAEQDKEEADDKQIKDNEKEDIKIVKKLQKALKKAEEERDAFRDSYQRTFSEFNNFKKRNATASCQAVKDGMGEAIEKILPVIDNFERALEHADEQKDDAFAQGVSMVYKQLLDILSAMDVKEIPAQDETFDPNLHQAIQQVECQEETKPCTVVTVVQKGYMLGDKILRHSMVIVSK